jgi:hypothetical protein
MSESQPFAEIRKFLKDGLLSEYNHGVDDGLTMALGGLTKVLAHPSLPDDMESGLVMAIDSIKAIQEELSNTRNKTNTAETNQGVTQDV